MRTQIHMYLVCICTLSTCLESTRAWMFIVVDHDDCDDHDDDGDDDEW